MKIILDAIAFSLQQKGGVTMYFSEMLKSLKKIAPVELINDFNSNNIYHNGTQGRLGYFRLFLYRYIHNNYKSKEKYIFHSSYFLVSKHRNAINVLTVHDCMYELYFPFFRRRLHVWQKKRALKLSSGIVCVSESTKRDLCQLYPEIKSKEIRVIHHGLSRAFTPLDNLVNDKVLLYVSGRKFYKRFDLVIESMVRLSDYQLVIVGGGALESYELDLLQPIQGRYSHLTNISNAELNVVYNTSHCLVYTSAYEGFGLPLLESIGAGCPAICENNSSLAEVVGSDYDLLVNTLNADVICDKVRALENQMYRSKVVERGIEFSKRFSWDAMARQLYDYYEFLYQESRSDSTH